MEAIKIVIDHIDLEILKLEDRIEELKKSRTVLLRTLDNEPALKQLAIDLHKNYCQHDHNDRCCWHYEIRNGVHDWKAYEHAVWLRKSKKVIDEHIDVEQVKKFTTIMSLGVPESG